MRGIAAIVPSAWCIASQCLEGGNSLADVVFLFLNGEIMIIDPAVATGIAGF